jgi:hypothetical protein
MNIKFVVFVLVGYALGLLTLWLYHVVMEKWFD